ncbi:MAG: winged helix-turn-helix domain-containing protein, partial [Hyphomicrobium sp.]
MTSYRFGSIHIQPHERRLTIEGRDVALGARALDVLFVLAERAGRVVSKNELLELVWRDVVVEENNLQVHISTLRKALGPSAIATIPGRGYALTLSRTDLAEKQNQSDPKTISPPGVLDHPLKALVTTGELYGRDDDVSAVAELARRYELVTIVGPAGIGKTRLAQAVAQRLHDEFPDGARIIELAPLADPALVTVTIASALGVPVGDARHALDLVVQALAEQRLLLVLDNCEHLLNEVDRMVAAFRKGAVQIHILATSQEVLRHQDEHVHRLGPLQVPDQSTLTAASGAGAIELFMARAQAVDVRVRLTESNVAAIVEICRRLDGIPLALELAAARVPLLGIDGVRTRLDERFRLLTAGSRLALRRHQTLRAALEWSYGLLSESEQEVFARLGVFAGSFSLESAQQIAANARMDQWEVLDHLGALVDKSLVVVHGEDSPRYRMLETTRAFALERLLHAGATQETMRRHAEVMLSLFECFHRDHFAGAPAAEMAERLSADHDNLRSALRWACGEEGDSRLAVALLGVAGSPLGYLRYVALRAEAWDLCEMVRPHVDRSTPVAEAARFWLACAHHGSDASPSAAIEYASRAIALYRELDDRAPMSLACSILAFSLLQTGRVKEAEAAMKEARLLRDPASPLWLRIFVDNIAALIWIEQGEVSEARRSAGDFLSGARQTGFREERTALAIFADVEILAGDLDGAARVTDEALKSRPPADDRLSASNRSSDGLNLRIFATALMLNGRQDEAEALYREALVRAKRSFGTGAFVLYDAATFLARKGDFKDAARVRAYASLAYERSGRRPRRVARLLDEQLLKRLTDEFPAELLCRLHEEGRQWTDDDACAAAFPALT